MVRRLLLAIFRIPKHYADPPATPSNAAPAEPAAATPAAPASTPADGGAAAATSSTTSTSGTGELGGAPATPSPATPPQDILSQLRTQYQIDLPADPAQAAQFLGNAFRQAQQAQQLAQYGQFYLQHQSEFDKWRQSQQQAAATEKPWWSEFWNPPEYQHGWESLLTTDAQGNVIPKPGTPPDVLPKYLAYQQFQREQAQQLMRNPFQFFEKPIQMIAQKIAMEEVRRHLGQYSEQNYATEFTRNNASWLYQRSGDGQVILDPVTRAPALSGWGTRFRDYVLHAQQMGIMDVRGQEQWAMGMVQRDYAISQMPAPGGAGGAPAGGAPVNPRDAANAQFLQQQTNGRLANPGSAPVVPANTPPQKISLAEQLRKQFQANGITDASLR
jgi:hypothetical protein